jgi:hypothetical protein
MGFFYNVDSYHGTGEYLVLVASKRPLVLTNVPTRTSPSRTYNFSISVAVFRSAKSKRMAKRKVRRG